MKTQMNGSYKYEDIIDLPHHVSKRHPQLKKESYAAQFCPFAALSGYDEIVAEAEKSVEVCNKR